jgi:hypothetical protein
MLHVWGIREINTGLCSGSVIVMCHVIDARVNVSLVKENGKKRIGLIWLRLETRDGLLWTRWLIFILWNKRTKCITINCIAYYGYIAIHRQVSVASATFIRVSCRWIYCNLCIVIVMLMYSYCMFMYLNRANWHSSATLTEVFPCFFLSCKANAKVKPAKDGARPALFRN